MVRRNGSLIAAYVVFMSVIPIIMMTFVINLTAKECVQYTCVAYIVMLIISVILCSDALKESVDMIKVEFNKKLEFTILVGAATFLVFTLSSAVINNNFAIANMNKQGTYQLVQNNFVVMSVLTVVVGPIVEELVFRVAINKLFRFSILGMIVSSVLFGVVHHINDIIIYCDLRIIWLTIPYILMGVGLACIYRKTKCIYLCVAYHMVVNLLATLVAYKNM